MPHHASTQPINASRQGEQQTFNQQLPNQVMPPGAHGQPHRDFSRTSGAAHQQQRGQVAAGNREHEGDDDEHQRSERGDSRVRLRVNAHIVRRHHRDPPAECKLSSGSNAIRQFRVEPASKYVHRGCGLRHGDALAEARLHE